MLTINGTSLSRQQSGSREISTPATSSDASDQTLITAIAAGDRRAMRVLYGRHSVRVYRFALRFVSDESVADDLVNEVFFDVWRKAMTFEGRSQVSTWLLAITRNKALQTVRRRSFEPLDEAACESIEDSADNPETAMQRKQNGSLLLQYLANLSPAHREIIDLVYYHEKSVEEISKIIHVPPSTVKTRMFYARKELAKMFAKSEHDRGLSPN